MQRLAFAQLDRPATPRQPAQRCIVELLALPGTADARHLVTTRQGALQDGVLQAAQDGALTAQPTTLARANARARDFVQRRLAQGDVLTAHEGLGEFDVPAAAPTSAAVAPPPPAAPSGVPPAIAALLARLDANRWRLLPPARRSRTVWRIGQLADAAPASPAGQALRASAPRLIELLESGDDLLDHAIAVACARLGDGGTAIAMQQLATRGRSPATRRMAAQAHWLLLPADARAFDADALDPLRLLAQPPAAAWPALQAAHAVEEGTLTARVAALYDLSLPQPAARAHVLQLARDLPLASGSFQALRVLYKHAELRRDAELLALLHARIEATRQATAPAAHVNPRTGQRMAPGHIGPPAYRRATRVYLLKRALRTLRRLHDDGHPHAPQWASALVLSLDAPARPLAHSIVALQLVLPRLPGLLASAHGTSARLPAGTDWARPLTERIDGLPALWDAAPAAALDVLLGSRQPAVQAVFARVLQDHAAYLHTRPDALRALLQSPFAPTAVMAFGVVRALLDQLPAAAQRPWLLALLHSPLAEALDHALLRIASQRELAADAALIAQLLLHPEPRARQMGHTLAQAAPLGTQTDLPAELLGALLALPAVDAEDTGIRAALSELAALLQGRLRTQALRVPPEQVLDLLTHPRAAAVHLGVDWLLLREGGALAVPPTLFSELLQSEDGERRAAGVRLLASLPDQVLAAQATLVRQLAVHPHAQVRAAIRPAALQLAARDSGFARALAADLHATLFAAASDDGLQDDALALLTGELAAHAPGRDAASVWRALHAQARAARTYGAWALAPLPERDFSWRQLAVLGKHEDASVRSYSLNSLQRRLGEGESVHIHPDEAAALLPLAESRFGEVQRFVQPLFTQRLADASLTVPVLTDWIDHPQPWLQTAARARLTRALNTQERALMLDRLAEHPGASVQLFLTQWLLAMPEESGPARAARLAGLQGFFTRVLSRVHHSRIAKNRITAFLRDASGDADCARVVADIFLRQVVSASLTDKPQYIAALRDIAARHPHITLPFVQPQAVSSRAR
ncbi:MAG: hypothetical protein Q4G71_09550 [Pseudomonadota bacterium]|nr:hypothetical protein [Pseudomonadota bacterium]